MSKVTRVKEVLRAPAHPFTGHQILKAVRDALAAERGFKMTIDRLSTIVGKGPSTTGYLFNVHPQGSVLAFISILERLSDSERYRVLNGICRALPSVLHPRLAHEPATVVALLKLLERQRGLTILRGGSEISRGFVLTALGHTYPQVDAQHRTAGGLDAHEPLKLVPVETVMYLRSQLSTDQIRRAVRDIWPSIRSSKAPLLLFNDVWSLVPEVRPDIVNWAKNRHVIIADAMPPGRSDVPWKKVQPIYVLTLSQAAGNPNFIRVTCQKPRASRRKHPTDGNRS